MLTPNYQRVRVLLFLAAVLALLLALAGCQQAPPPAQDTRASDEQAIRGANDEEARAFAAHDSAKVASLYAEDVVAMTTGAPMVHSRAEMQQWLEDAMEHKAQNTWNIAKIEVARSGDLAYCWGTGKFTLHDKQGKDLTTDYQYVTVYKRQADGSWKMAVDTMIPEGTPKPAAKQAK